MDDDQIVAAVETIAVETQHAIERIVTQRILERARLYLPRGRWPEFIETLEADLVRSPR